MLDKWRLLTDEEKLRYHEQESALNNSRRAEGILSKSEFYGFLFEFLSMPHVKALDSDNIVILAMAVLDRRLGKRRIPKLYDRYQSHPLLKRLYEFRCEVEGVTAISKVKDAS